MIASLTRHRRSRVVKVGDLICRGRYRVTMLKNPDASLPIISAIDDDGGVALLQWNGHRWDHL